MGKYVWEKKTYPKNSKYCLACPKTLFLMLDIFRKKFQTNFRQIFFPEASSLINSAKIYLNNDKNIKFLHWKIINKFWKNYKHFWAPCDWKSVVLEWEKFRIQNYSWILRIRFLGDVWEGVSHFSWIIQEFLRFFFFWELEFFAAGNWREMRERGVEIEKKKIFFEFSEIIDSVFDHYHSMIEN